MSAESFADLLNADSGDLLDGIGDAVSQAVILMIKQQAVQDFFSNNEISCPHCDQRIEPTEMQPDTDKGVDLSTAETTKPQSSDSVDSEDIAEAKKLLEKVDSWTYEELEQLPPPARKKVRQYRGVYSELDSA